MKSWKDDDNNSSCDGGHGDGNGHDGKQQKLTKSDAHRETWLVSHINEVEE